MLTEDKEQFSTCISPIKRAFKPQPSPQLVKYNSTMFPATISQIVRQSVGETINQQTAEELDRCRD